VRVAQERLGAKKRVDGMVAGGQSAVDTTREPIMRNLVLRLAVALATFATPAMAFAQARRFLGTTAVGDAGAAVPEPTALLAFAVGALVVGHAVRRQRQRG
jgi:hypothetical protein